MVAFHAAQPADLPFVYACICDLEEVILDYPAFGQIFLNNLNNPVIRYVVAWVDDLPVGFLSCHVQGLLHHAGLVGEIQEMYVLPHWRSRGVGQQLVEHILATARHEGWINLEVTSNRRRVRTHAFYERLGFSNTHLKLVQSI